LLLGTVTAALVLVSASGLGPPRAEAAATPAASVVWRGTPWTLSGASVPWFTYGCDFGCRQNGGVVGNAELVNKHFQQLSRNGVKVVRWQVMAGAAWQIARGPDGSSPVLRANSVFPDLDRAVELARANDVYLQLVLFEDARQLPPGWFAQPELREQLALALRPLFARHARSAHVLAWELFDEPERAIDSGAVAAVNAQALVARLAAEVHARSSARVTVGAAGVHRLATWVGLGLDYHSPHWWSFQTSGPACAGCTTTAELALSQGVDAPVVIGATDASDPAAAAQRLRDLRARGYAGTLLFSSRGAAPAPDGTLPTVPLEAPWAFLYESPTSVGPHDGPVNPCLGPAAGALRCPDLRMSPPRDFSLGKLAGRTVLFSRNSINSVGAGPAELLATRSGLLTMNAVQKIWRAGRGKLEVRTGAKVVFKSIPGQGPYWKWRDAATMELWRLDGAGNPVRLVRRGPKTVYCLRDLRRTRGGLAGAPAKMFYPACSRKLSQRKVTLGTSVGWSDIYPATYHENWVDVSGLRGCFAYVHVADPTNVIYESDENNNTSQGTVRLPFTGSNAGCPNARQLPSAGEDPTYAGRAPNTPGRTS